MKKRILALAMTLVIAASTVIQVEATKIEDLKREQAAAQSKLEEQRENITGMQQKQEKLLSEIDSKEAELVLILSAIETLEQEITEKEDEIETTKKELEKAEATKAKQYEAMKKRIQYLYEKGGENAWAQALLENGDITELLSKAENTQKLYDYDKQCREEFISVVEEIKELEAQLQGEKEELITMKAENEEQQKALSKIISQKKAASENYESQIASAKQKASEYTQMIKEYNVEIKKAVEAQRKAEEARRKAEEARKKAEEEARKKAEEAAKKEQEANNKKPGNGNNNSSNNGGNSGSSEKPGNSAGSAKGKAVVNYALQFVGNPYVWGGTSLTNGADCSGFTMSVYKHFGVNIPHSSAAQASVGRAVSYADAQPGDLICYSGHVAIYIGNGAIVHASSSAPYPIGGIKVSNNAAYRKIIAVRRIF